MRRSFVDEDRFRRDLTFYPRRQANLGAQVFAISDAGAHGADATNGGIDTRSRRDASGAGCLCTAALCFRDQVSHHSMTSQLSTLIGDHIVSTDDRFGRRMRQHQGWWRACVLDLPPGERSEDGRTVCNRLPRAMVAQDKSLNFLTPQALAAAQRTLAGRGAKAAGIVQEARLYGNLLSSQPLAFNFFGPLAEDPELRLARRMLPQLLGLGDVEITGIEFEYAHSEKPINDNTAFDVAVKFARGGRPGLVGIECKYTEPFSPEPYDRQRYRDVFETSKAFTAAYDDLVQSCYNQLLRTHLLSQALRLAGDFTEVHTCVFSSGMKGDKCPAIAADFKARVRQLPTSLFFQLDFATFIAQAQQLDLSWPEREWTMQLWARYCATSLSERVARS